MKDHLWTIAALLALVAGSAFFSASETAFSSLNRTRLKAMSMSGNKRAQKTLDLSEKYDRLLSSVLIGNNIVNILASSIATVAFVALLGDQYGVTVATVAMTLIILIFGEISPKSLAKENPERFALAVTPILSFIMRVLTPLTLLFDQWRKLLSRVFKTGDAQSITEDELMILVDEAENDGGIDENEGTLIRAAIEFNELDVTDILTHRIDIEAIPDTATIDDIITAFEETGFSRLPVYNDTIDNIVGVVLEKDFYRALRHPNFSMMAILKQPLFITTSTSISALLNQIQRSKTHMAIVVDEFGGTEGLVTLEDILEELVGEIWDEHDDVVDEFRQTGEGRYIINCSADLDDLFDLFEITVEDYDAVTVGGWVMQELSRIPALGDTFTYRNLFITVTKTEQRRPVEIEVTVIPEAEAREAM